MTYWTPVLYLEQKIEQSQSEQVTDWQLCVSYEGWDTYTVYAHRNSTNQYFSLEFLSRSSLSQFLNRTLQGTVETSLYLVDVSELHRDNFQNYYCAYSQENQLFEDRGSSWTEEDFASLLLLLRDMRVQQ